MSAAVRKLERDLKKNFSQKMHSFFIYSKNKTGKIKKVKRKKKKISNRNVF